MGRRLRDTLRGNVGLRHLGQGEEGAVLPRDRFGIKPFYYIHAGDRFYFGSEYAPLKLSPIFNSTFDLDQISRGLRLGLACYQEETYFKCLKALPSGATSSSRRESFIDDLLGYPQVK